VSEEKNLFLHIRLVVCPLLIVQIVSRTSLRTCRSSGVNSGSLGATTSFFGFSASASLAGLVDLGLDLGALAVGSLAGLGDSTPFEAALGVAELVSFILGFLTESER
jgi:hypothetical protein